jgi:hypothetical protein
MRGSRLVRLGAAVAAGMLAVGPGGPAYAADTIDINSDHLDKPATAFESDCDPNFGGGPYPGQDVWVFVLPQKQSLGTFTSVTVTFNTPNGPVTLTIPDDSGEIEDDNGTSKAWIITDAGWTIDAASAEITGTADENDSFNLTHTCPASSTPGPTSTPPTPKVTTPAVVTPSGAPETGGGGGQESGSVALGAGAIVLAGAAGIGLIAVARRRRADG